MVKIRKNKSKLLNKPSKLEKNEIKSTGKITKKKTGQNRKSADKKTSVIKELASHSNELIDLKTDETKKQLRFVKASKEQKPPQPKKKSVEKQKKRQKTQIDDTKLLLKLMKKK